MATWPWLAFQVKAMVKSFFFAQRVKKRLGRSPPQELEEGTPRGPHLLESVNCVKKNHKMSTNLWKYQTSDNVFSLNMKKMLPMTSQWSCVTLQCNGPADTPGGTVHRTGETFGKYVSAHRQYRQYASAQLRYSVSYLRFWNVPNFKHFPCCPLNT